MKYKTFYSNNYKTGNSVECINNNNYNKFKIFFVLCASTIVYNSLMDCPQALGYPLSNNSSKTKYAWSCDCSGGICEAYTINMQDEPTVINNTNYDTISKIDGNLFVFKNKYVWEFKNGTPYQNNPYRLEKNWKFPNDDNFKKIDSVYQNKENKTVFFIGKKYYIFDENTLEDDYPKPLTDLGLPETLDKIDAALTWEHNNKTYFFSGTSYWGFDEDEGKVELNYPRNTVEWDGIDFNVYGTYQYTNGNFKPKYK